VKGTASIDDTKKVLNPELSGDDGIEDLLKATEQDRRDRARRIDSGDEGARLQFKVPAGGGAKRPAQSSGPPAKVPKAPGGRPQWRPYAG